MGVVAPASDRPTGRQDARVSSAACDLRNGIRDRHVATAGRRLVITNVGQRVVAELSIGAIPKAPDSTRCEQHASVNATCTQGSSRAWHVHSRSCQRHCYQCNARETQLAMRATAPAANGSALYQSACMNTAGRDGSSASTTQRDASKVHAPEARTGAKLTSIIRPGAHHGSIIPSDHAGVTSPRTDGTDGWNAGHLARAADDILQVPKAQLSLVIQAPA